jgi:predicted transcriptional regulator
VEPLSESQLAFMQALWRRPGSTVAQVKASLEERGRNLAQTTVATVLGRLEKKGLVQHESVGRQYTYRARVSEHEVQSSVLDRVTNGLFGGDASALICQLLDHEDVGPEALAQVRQLIEAKERGDLGAEDESGPSSTGSKGGQR